MCTKCSMRLMDMCYNVLHAVDGYVYKVLHAVDGYVLQCVTMCYYVLVCWLFSVTFATSLQ